MNLTIVAMLLAAVSTAAVIVLAFVLMRDRRSDDSPAITEVAGKVGDIEQSLAQSQAVLDQTLGQLDSKMVGLQKTVDQREGALGQQVSQIDSRVSGIADAFTNDRARGGWGELSLRRLLEMGGLVADRDFKMQFGAEEGVPDAVVLLPGDRKIVIDAKFPIARFNDALNETDRERRAKLMKDHAKEIEKMGKTLNQRGYANIGSGDFVVMYLPSQAVWEAAVEADTELVGRLFKQRVIVAGPASLFALLLTAAALLAENRFVGEAQAVLDDARELHKRLAKFTEYFQGVGTHLGRAVGAFNSAVGSWTGRLSPQINRMAERAAIDRPSEAVPIDDTVRDLPNTLEIAS
jgi:DNA recombination protein RmuC